jgi:hypothetical protein
MFSGSALLNYFRQISMLSGRTLLGMLLIVWLSMALSPCVMAGDLSPSELQASASATMHEKMMHEKMADCAYCPDKAGAASSKTLCQHNHGYSPDSLVVAIDSVDVDSFVLFEIPTAQPASLVQINLASIQIQPFSKITTLSPLALTGILRI